TLAAEHDGQMGESLHISGPSGGAATNLSLIGASAIAHGKELLELGYSVDQVVHDYGDICQAITDLGVERDAPFSVDEFRTLNRCLDNAIANAVSEFSAQRDVTFALKQSADENERRGILIHELRNHVHTATMAYQALQFGRLAIGGSTGDLLKRSLGSLSRLLSDSEAEVRVAAHAVGTRASFSLALFIADAASVAALDAANRGCPLTVPSVDPLLAIAGDRDRLLDTLVDFLSNAVTVPPLLAIAGDRDRLLDALVNLLQNALKFTHPRTEVTLHAYAVSDRVSIDVSDHCGGLPRGSAEKMFVPFVRGIEDKSGL